MFERVCSRLDKVGGEFWVFKYWVRLKEWIGLIGVQGIKCKLDYIGLEYPY